MKTQVAVKSPVVLKTNGAPSPETKTNEVYSKINGKTAIIDAKNGYHPVDSEGICLVSNNGCKSVDYRDLNRTIRALVGKGEIEEITLKNVNGQRYIGDGINKKVKIIIEGVPGNDLGAFMDGPEITVYSNAQDHVGNTMNDGKIVIHGMAGDVPGYAMRGGKIFVRDDVGYRVGIHMKEYKEKKPVIIAGGKAGDFFGEYMAGGIAILLGLTNSKAPIAGNCIGTGMHGGVIYIADKVNERQLGKEVCVKELNENDKSLLETLLKEFSTDLNLDFNKIMEKKFIKLVPESYRPYGKLYAV